MAFFCILGTIWEFFASRGRKLLGNWKFPEKKFPCVFPFCFFLVAGIIFPFVLRSKEPENYSSDLLENSHKFFLLAETFYLFVSTAPDFGGLPLHCRNRLGKNS